MIAKVSVSSGIILSHHHFSRKSNKDSVQQN
uniref:Uncharacterized protein n=1 Tax=Arundo donax TaxID=35708 RepID=A0A0A9FJT3_ARUDO